MGRKRKGELSAEEAAEYLRVSLPTLWRIEKKGGLGPRRNHKGQRWYTVEELNRYLEESRR